MISKGPINPWRMGAAVDGLWRSGDAASSGQCLRLTTQSLTQIISPALVSYYSVTPMAHSSPLARGFSQRPQSGLQGYQLGMADPLRQTQPHSAVGGGLAGQGPVHHPAVGVQHERAGDGLLIHQRTSPSTLSWRTPSVAHPPNGPDSSPHQVAADAPMNGVVGGRLVNQGTGRSEALRPNTQSKQVPPSTSAGGQQRSALKSFSPSQPQAYRTHSITHQGLNPKPGSALNHHQLLRLLNRSPWAQGLPHAASAVASAVSAQGLGAVDGEVAALRGMGVNAPVVPGSVARSVRLQAKAEANALRRLKEREAATPGAHYLQRHGAQLDLQSQFDRAAYGVNPTTGEQGRPTNATRFLSYRDQLHVIDRAENIYRLTGNADLARVPIQCHSMIGSGYQKGTLHYGVQYSGQVYINQSTGKAITAFPIWGQ